MATPRIVVLVGLPGSGKSTYLERLGVTALSSDAVRGLLADDVTDQSIHREVFATLRYLLRRRLALARPATYLDATHLTPRERRPYIKMGQLYGCSVEAVFFDVPLEVCRERNRGRARVVPEDALERMAAKLVPPTVEEGFSTVTVEPGSPSTRYPQSMENEPLDTSEDLDLVSVFSSDQHTADMEAAMIQSILEAGGIPSVIVGGVEMPNLPCEVRVPQSRLEDALLLIAESQAAGPRAADEAEKASEEMG